MRGRAAASWALAILGAIALIAGALVLYAEHTLFRSDPFADRVAATLRTPAVRDAVARRVTSATIAVKPDLVAVRPIVELAARGIVGTEAFRSLVRSGARESHRAAFDRDAHSVTVQVRDAGVLLAGAVGRLRPDAAPRVPAGVKVKIVRIKGGVDGAMLALAEAADRARPAGPIALGLGALLLVAALVVTDSRRAAVVRIGVAAAGAGALVALAAAVLPGALATRVGGGDHDAVAAVAGAWLDPILAWAVAAALVGALVAVAAGSLVRPIAVAPIARRAWAAATAPPRSAAQRAARIAALALVGVALIAWPRTVLTVAALALGVGLVLAALGEALAMAGSEPAPARARGGAARAARMGAVVAVLAAGAVAVAAVADEGAPAAPRVGRCNGHAALCDRRVDDVAFLGTHNAMAASGEPSWLFAAQDAGIPQQLDDGVRALMIDTHYGRQTARGVFTDLSGETKSRSKLVETLGAPFVATAERARTRIGRRPGGRPEVFLCHAFCEVGATKAVQALKAVHRFLVTHPEEVVILSIEDDTSAAATAAMIRASGLVDEVYRGDAAPPWPTLRELVDRDERVIVLSENHAGGAPWIHHQPAVMQETPFHFATAAQLSAPASCAPNRGGTAGSLLLVNHWVDTSPAPRVTIAREVNARGFLDPRLARCRRVRGMLPNVVAVDFYRQGDPLAAVDELNGVGR